MEPDGAAEAPGASSTATPNVMTEQQLNEFILTCSRGVGSLVHLIEEEAEKLPEGIQPQVTYDSPKSSLAILYLLIQHNRKLAS